MKNPAILFLTLGIIFGSIGCQKPAPANTKFSLDRPFPLQIGQTAVSADVLGFTIKFDKVAEDSRCRMGVQCITAGKADVVLTLTKGGETQVVTLPFTLPNGTSNVTDFKGHTIRVMGVAPLKYKDKEIKPEEYSLVLLVTLTPPRAKLEEDFALSVGESIQIEENSKYSIRFDSVSGDNRCPEGVECITAGRADCVFTLSNGDSSQVFTLSTGNLNNEHRGEAFFAPYTLRLKAVAPFRRTGVTLQQKDYQTALALMK